MHRNYDNAHHLLTAIIALGWLGAAAGIIGGGAAAAQSSPALAIYAAGSILGCLGISALGYIGRAVLHLAEDAHATTRLLEAARPGEEPRGYLSQGARMRTPPDRL